MTLGVLCWGNCCLLLDSALRFGCLLFRYLFAGFVGWWYDVSLVGCLVVGCVLYL